MPDQPLTTSHDFTVPGDVALHGTIHPGNGPALLLIHGITSSGETWHPILDAIAEHVTPVTFDLRGHGQSARPPHGYDLDDYIDDLERLLAFLGLDRPLIMGHSLGGLVTLWWAARHPDRAAALLIEDSPLRSGEDFVPAFDNWLHLNTLSYEQLREHFATEHPHWKPEAVDRRSHQMHITSRNAIAELKQYSLAHEGLNRIDEIANITSPALLIYGDTDAGGMVRQDIAGEFGRRLANAGIRHIPGGGHNLHLDRMRAFLEAAIPFLQDHGANAGRPRL